MTNTTPSIADIKIKMKALRQHLVNRVMGDPDRSEFPTYVVGDYFRRYRTMAQALRADLPSLFGDLPDGVEAEGEDRIKRSLPVPRQLLWELAAEMHFCNEILGKVEVAGVGTPRVTREGAFFAGQQYDALRAVQEIIGQATKDIHLIDGYVAESTLDLMTVKPNQATVRILTLSNTANAAFKAAASAFNTQYGGLSVRLSNVFHDRFLIIDGADYYHFGASLKDLGKRGFMFSKIEEPAIISALTTQTNAAWQSATVAI